MPYENLYLSLALDGDLLFAISPREASLLIALDNDLRDPSEVDAELPNEGDWVLGMSPFLEPAGHLKSSRDKLEKGLLKAIELGRIKPVAAARNVDGRLDPIYSLLALSDVRTWCDEHDFDLGDWWSRYELDEQEFASTVAEDIVAHRTPSPMNPEPTESSKARMEEYSKAEGSMREEIFRKTVLEIEALKSRHDGEHLHRESPINTREKNSLLAVIAAFVTALEDRLPEGYKRAEAVSRLTEQVGASVSVNTVDKILKQADSAVDRRREAFK
jgi:hypothetical protein